MHKKIAAIGIFVSIGLAFLGGIFSNAMTPAFLSSFYELAGLGFMIFGIWGGILLLKKDK